MLHFGYMAIVFALFFAFTIHADKISYPPQRLSAAGIKQIRIAGVKGHLILRDGGAQTKFYKISVHHSRGKKFDDWSLSVDRVGDALVLEVFNVALGPQWRRLVRDEAWPEFDIELTGPARPAVVAWREGAIDVVAWKNNVDATFTGEQFTAHGMKGALKLQSGNGEVEIADHQGALNLRGERGRVRLRGVKGAVDLNWLEGTVEGVNLRGPLNVDLTSGRVALRDFSGPLRGKGESAAWAVEAAAPTQVEVISRSGPVAIHWGLGSAKMFLSSATGAIQVPKPLAIELREGLRVVESAPAPRPRGNVFVRTQSGVISWR